MTIVGRAIHCILGWKLVWEPTEESIQTLVDEAPKAKFYFSNGLEAYSLLWYHYGQYAVSDGKSDTYSVEGDNAEFRHYLARLARSSRCDYALSCALHLFVDCFNRRQLYKQRFPRYPAHLIDFVYPPN